MARSTSTTGRSTDAPRDAIALLKQDHRTVSQLFEEFEKADDEEQSAIAQRVCQLLTVHGHFFDRPCGSESRTAARCNCSSLLPRHARSAGATGRAGQWRVTSKHSRFATEKT